MNNLLNTYRFYFLPLVLASNFTFAQEKIKKDSSNLDVRYFKENIKERFDGDDFNYSINDKGGANLIQRIFQKFFGWMNEVFGVNLDFIDYKTLEWIVYSLMAAGTLYLLLKFLSQAPLDAVFKNKDSEIEGFTFAEENITQVDFESLIEDAVSQQNYRLATRYMYLKSLKKLASKNIIEWHYDKTNSEYLNEIANAETKKIFKRISYIYDYVWYGEFAVDEEMFKQNSADFAKLNAL
ncbi:hypothetical protein SAMN03097699_1450 [Flavobacteriaceae bacterium MAR_2010_188]|nr:hypothetical protein SAMN03097699_1450 [Flavobacteriaceae bacterium MAR_2010_188]